MEIQASTKKIVNNQFVSLSALKIEDIPDITTLARDGEIKQSVLGKQKRNFQSLLSEIHHIFSKSKEKISVEIAWITEPVENQLYGADIGLYIIIRSLSSNKNISIENVERVTRETITNLGFQRYHTKSINIEELENKLNYVNDEKTNAVFRDIERERLETPIIDECFAYDCFSEDLIELEELVYILTQYPNAILSFQVNPTDFTNEEKVYIDNTTQALSILSQGVDVEDTKILSIAKAKRLIDNYEYYSRKKMGDVFLYNIVISGETKAVDDITSKVIGYLQRDNNDIGFKRKELPQKLVSYKKNLYPLPWATASCVMEVIEEKIGSEIGKRLPLIASTDEIIDFFRLPVGSNNISAGLPINYANTIIRKYKKNVIDNGRISLGTLKNSSKNNQIRIGLDDLTKHTLVVGTPGSGKTTLLVGLLNEIYKNNNIPFLVIEPAKNEYRALVNEIEDLQVFTPGKDHISPLIINPFVPPKNVKLQAYKSVLKTAFTASIPMHPPLDMLFAETVDNCYAENGWLDDYTVDDGGKIFNIEDFINCFERTVKEVKYTGESANIGKAGKVRLQSLSRWFKNYNTIPIEDILKKPTVIELSAIENDEDKSLIIALILLSILSYVNANVISKGELNNLILLEEAHVLLDAPTDSENKSNDIAQRLVKRILAELRSAGVGMIIADQSPRKVTTDVVALTDIKVALRIVEKQDREIIENSINLDDDKSNRLSRFQPGEAYVFFNKLEVAEEVDFTDYRQENKIDITISDEDLKQKTAYWKNQLSATRPYPNCELICKGACDNHKRLLAEKIAKTIATSIVTGIINKKYVGEEKRRYINDKLQNIKPLITQELGKEKYSDELEKCVVLHTKRALKYKHKINLNE